MSDLSCAKCGGTEIRTSYHAAAAYEFQEASPDCLRSDRNTRRREHLHRYCQTCHWDWTNDVLAPVSSSGRQETETR